MLVGEIAVFAAFTVGYVLARLRRGTYHHYLMFGAFAADLLVFKPLMFSRAYGGAWGGPPWEGTGILLHLVLDTVTFVVGVAAIYLGFRHRLRKDGRMFMPPKGKMHRWLGRAFVVLWALTLLGGLRIFLDTYLP